MGSVPSCRGFVRGAEPMNPLVSHDLAVAKSEKGGLAAVDLNAAGSAACSVAHYDRDLVAYRREALELHPPVLPPIENALDRCPERLDPTPGSRFDGAGRVDVLDLRIQQLKRSGKLVPPPGVVDHSDNLYVASRHS